MLGATFDRRLEEYKNLENTTDGEYYDIQPFLEIGMKYTADFINGLKEKLSHDLDMLVGANDVMVDNTILQKFYLLESQKKEVCISLKKIYGMEQDRQRKTLTL